MHQLTIADNTGSVVITAYSSFDGAHRALLRHIVGADYYLHTVEHTRARTRYELLCLADPGDHHRPARTPRVAGAATIEHLPDPQLTPKAPEALSHSVSAAHLTAHRATGAGSAPPRPPIANIKRPATASGNHPASRPARRYLMSAPRPAGPALRAVSDTTATHGGEDYWRAQTVLDQYSLEHQLVGSLLWLGTAAARPVLNLVPDNAIARPCTRWAYELIRRVVDEGADPTPVAVLAAGRHRAARGALHPDTAPPADQLHQLALYVFDAYAHAVAPAAAIASYARAVLDEAYRRAVGTGGLRLHERAESGAHADELAAHFADLAQELADLRRRADTAALRTAQRLAPSPVLCHADGTALGLHPEGV